MILNKPYKIIYEPQNTICDIDLLRNKTIDECFDWFDQKLGNLEIDRLQIYVPIRCVKELIKKLENRNE